MMIDKKAALVEPLEPESESGAHVQREPAEVERAKAWFTNMPQPWKQVYEQMKRRQQARATGAD